MKVQDVEDQPPEFVVVSPVTRVSEDAPPGTSVLQGALLVFEGSLCLNEIIVCLERIVQSSESSCNKSNVLVITKITISTS